MTCVIFSAMRDIKQIADQADVHGKVRVSITFDSAPDRERFKAEVERQIRAGGLQLTYDGRLSLSECTVYGVGLRLI